MTVTGAGSRPLSTNRNFLRYWAAGTISRSGSQISVIALPLLSFSLGGGVTGAGLVASCGLLTRVAGRLPAGLVADRVNRRLVMLASDLIRMLAMMSLPAAAALDRLTFVQLVPVALIEGLGTAAFAPAASIALRDMLSPDQISPALSRIQASASTAGLMGPLIGGWLYGVNRMLPFGVNSASYAVSALLLWRLRIKLPGTSQPKSARFTASAGLRWLWGQQNMRRVVIFASVLNLLYAATEIMLIVSVRQQTGSASTIGAVMACGGIGSVLGALGANWLIRHLRMGLLLLLVGISSTAGLTAFSMLLSPPLIGAIFVMLMLVSPAAGILVGQSTLTGSPPGLLGRVTTAVDTATAGLAAAGPLLAGVLVSLCGLSGAWLLLALAAAVTTALTVRPFWSMTSMVTAGNAMSGFPHVAGDTSPARVES